MTSHKRHEWDAGQLGDVAELQYEIIKSLKHRGLKHPRPHPRPTLGNPWSDKRPLPAIPENSKDLDRV